MEKESVIVSVMLFDSVKQSVFAFAIAKESGLQIEID